MLPEPFVEYVRGPIVESIHYGAAAVADATGRLVQLAGDPDLVSYYRSASKPIQAVPLVESGAADRFGFTPAEIALVCGSHGGEPIHVAAAASMLRKIGLGPEWLACGVHPPYDRAAAQALAASGVAPAAIHNNCSGKHAGMLALCVFHGWDPHGYETAGHPVQQLMLQTVADFCAIAPSAVATGTDGCSVITFGVSMTQMAASFARLAQPPAEWAATRRTACARITAAMTAHPAMVAAQQERLDTDLMRAFGGRLIAKAGAEGVYCMATLPQDGSPAVGLALKLLDGDEGGRARNPAVMGLLDQAGLLDDRLRAALATYIERPILNRAGLHVGTVRSVLRLRRRDPGRHVA
ncbi:MAG: asparaginase [Chloroflexota bacterium]|nr:asparaginase [Chloroflexota bacterium]